MAERNFFLLFNDVLHYAIIAGLRAYIYQYYSPIYTNIIA